MKTRFDLFEETIAIVCLSIMTVLTFVNVVARYVFSASLSFSDEITTNLFVLLTLVGAAIATKRGAHLGLTLLTDNLTDQSRKMVAVLGNLLAIVFCTVLFYQGVLMAINEYRLEQLTAGMQLPEWIFGSFVPFGALILMVRFLQNLFKSMKEEVM